MSSFLREATTSRTAVMYGAGNIGRGFLGQLLSDSGYEVVFVDLDDAVVARLNADRAYPLRVVSNAGTRERTIRNVRAVHGRDRDGVAAAIGGADLMATAVGVNALPHVAGPIAAGLHVRWVAGKPAPLDIIICENLIDANRYLRRLVGEALPEAERPWLEARVGFVEASIGRMVPVMTPEMQEGNPLRIWVEEHAELPVDRDGFRGPIPPVRGLVPFSPFGFYIHRKLFIHNMGHALVAYLGQPKGYRYVWEAVADAEILRVARAAMTESACALAAEHGVALDGLTAHIEDLLARFANRQLGDTLDRVGRDLSRKLARDDRMIGALRCCLRNGIQPVNVCLGIAAALRFQDPVPGEVSLQLRAGGPEEVLERVCQIAPGSWEWEQILGHYRALGTRGA